jgi:tyrosyl-DNA phosphodiesterase 2
VILLQELHASALPTLLAHPWVRHNFQVSDVQAVAAYFVVTLVTLELRVSKVVRIPFEESRMNRDVLLVDIDVQRSSRRGGGGRGVLRIANTHLESLTSGFGLRLKQLQTVAAYLKVPGVVAGIAAGDMNALLRKEKYLPAMPGIGLGDVWDIEERLLAARTGRMRRYADGNCGELVGHTWGYQGGASVMHQPTRRDKVLYSGEVVFGRLPANGRVLRRVGVGLQYHDSKSVSGYAWVSDHYGLAVSVKVAG